MVVANVPNNVVQRGYLSITDYLSDRLEQIFSIAPQADVQFAYQRFFPVVKLESAVKLETDDKLLAVHYAAHSTTDIDNVPEQMKGDCKLIPTPENIATLLEAEESTKTIEVFLYDSLIKTYGQRLIFSIWGEGKAIVRAEYIKKSEEDREGIWQACERATGDTLVDNPALDLLAPGNTGNPILYPSVVNTQGDLSKVLGAIAPGYTLPLHLFTDFTGRDFPDQIDINQGVPNKVAVEEIVENLIPAAIENLNLE